MMFLLYIHLVHLILLLRLCVDLVDILVLYTIDCCMTTPLLLDYILNVYVGHTCIPFTSKSLVSIDSFSLYCVFDWRLVAHSLLFDRTND